MASGSLRGDTGGGTALSAPINPQVGTLGWGPSPSTHGHQRMMAGGQPEAGHGDTFGWPWGTSRTGWWPLWGGIWPGSGDTSGDLWAWVDGYCLNTARSLCQVPWVALGTRLMSHVLPEALRSGRRVLG